MTNSTLDRHLRGLEAFSWQLNSSLALESVLGVLADGVEQMLGADRCTIFLRDARTERVQCVLARGLSVEYTEAVERLYRQLPGGMLLAERAQWIEDARSEARFEGVHELIEQEGFRSMLLVGLRHQDVALGAFVAYYDHIQGADDQRWFLAQTLANQAAVAIKHVQSYAAAQLRLTELEKLRQAAVEINGQRDLESTLDVIARHAVDMLGVFCTYIYLYDPVRNQLIVRAGYNVPPSHIGRRMDLGEGLAGRVFVSGEPAIVADHATWEGASPVWKDVDFGTILQVPLRYREDTLGVLAFVHQTGHLTFDDDAMRAAGLFAYQAAASLASALGLAEIHRRADHLMALQRVTTAVTASLDLQDLLQLVVDELQRTFGYTLTSILRREGDLLVSQATAVMAGRVSGNGDLALSQGIIGRAARTGQSQYVADVSQDSDFVLLVTGTGVEACVPVMMDGSVWGVLNVEAENSSVLSPSDVALLEMLSQQISVAISNARLYRAVQRRIEETERLKKFNEDLLRGVEAGILLERVDDRIEFVNPRLCEMVGYSAEQLVGEPTAMLLSSEMDAYVDRQATGRRSGEKGRYEAALLHRDGYEVPVLVNSTPVFENGLFVGTLTAFADITQRKRTEQTLLALNSAAATVRRATDPQQVHTTISRELYKLGLSSGIFTADPASGTVQIEHLNYAGKLEGVVPIIEEMLKILFQRAPLGGLPHFGRAVKESHAVFEDQPMATILDTLSELGKVWPDALPEGLFSLRAILAPLISQRRTFGILAVVGEQLTEADLPAVEAFANQTSVALDNARLLAAERRERQRAEILSNVARILSSALDLEVALHEVMEQLQRIIPYDGSALYLLQDGQLHCRAVEGVVAQAELGSVLDVLASPALSEMVQSPRPMLFTHTQMEVREQGMPGDAHAASWIGAPLVAEGQLFGLLSVETAQADFYDAEDLHVMATFADQVSVAIQRAKHYSDSQQRLRELSNLAQVSAALNEAFDLASVLDVVLASACDLVGTDRGVVALVDKPGLALRVVAARGQDASFAERINQARRELPLDLSLDPVIRPRVLVEPSDAGRMFDQTTCVVLRLEGQVIGLIELDLAGLDEKRHRLLMALADLAAAAIDKARLYDETRRAYEDLRQMDRLKDEFVSNVSHELRTPLTFVKGYVEYLLEGYAGDLNTEQREALTIVLDRSNAVVRLVDDIISLKRAEMYVVDMAPVDLAEVARACAQGSLAAANKAGVTIVQDFAPHLPHVLGDAKRLGQVFDNLIGNAIKFSPNGGVVTVRLLWQYDKVQVRIRDTGIGIPKDNLNKIWDRFYQIDSTSTRRFAGTGLGLAIVKRIVEAHRGEITVESTMGEGTTFCFTLPVYAPHEDLQTHVALALDPTLETGGHYGP